MTNIHQDSVSQMDNFNLFSDIDFSDLLFDSEELNFQSHEELLNDLGFISEDNCFSDTNLNLCSDVPSLFDDIAESFPQCDSPANHVDCVPSPEDIPIDIEAPIDVEDILVPWKEPKIVVTLKKAQPTKRKIIVASVSKKQDVSSEVINEDNSEISLTDYNYQCINTNLLSSKKSHQTKSTEGHSIPNNISSPNRGRISVENNKNNSVKKIQIVHPPISRQATKVRILIGGKKSEVQRQKSCLLSSPSYLPPSPPNSDIELSPRRSSSIITDISSPAMLAGGILRLSEEEKRTLISEGYTIPNRLPLTKQEERILKRVQRKIKNKMSAQESRRKKKDYLESLERRLDYTNEENGRLKQKLVTLENNNRTLLGQLKHMQELLSNCSKTTKTILMNLIVFFAVFAGILNIDFTTIKSQDSAAASSNDYTSTTKPSRVLLSINEDTESPNYKSDWSFLWTCKENEFGKKEMKILNHDHDYYYNVDDYISEYYGPDCEMDEVEVDLSNGKGDEFANESYGRLNEKVGGDLITNNKPVHLYEKEILNYDFNDQLDFNSDSGRGSNCVDNDHFEINSSNIEFQTNKNDFKFENYKSDEDNDDYSSLISDGDDDIDYKILNNTEEINGNDKTNNKEACCFVPTTKKTRMQDNSSDFITKDIYANSNTFENQLIITRNDESILENGYMTNKFFELVKSRQDKLGKFSKVTTKKNNLNKRNVTEILNEHYSKKDTHGLKSSVKSFRYNFNNTDSGFNSSSSDDGLKVGQISVSIKNKDNMDNKNLLKSASISNKKNIEIVSKHVLNETRYLSHEYNGNTIETVMQNEIEGMELKFVASMSRDVDLVS